MVLNIYKKSIGKIPTTLW